MIQHKSPFDFVQNKYYLCQLHCRMYVALLSFIGFNIFIYRIMVADHNNENNF